MTLRNFSIGAAAACLFALMVVPAEAAPLSATSGQLRQGAGTASNVEKAAYRRCWWRYGERYCRWVRDYNDDYGYYDRPYYGYGYGPYYGYGPSVGFFYGGRGGHFRGHHHHHR